MAKDNAVAVSTRNSSAVVVDQAFGQVLAFEVDCGCIDVELRNSKGVFINFALEGIEAGLGKPVAGLGIVGLSLVGFSCQGS